MEALVTAPSGCSFVPASGKASNVRVTGWSLLTYIHIACHICAYSLFSCAIYIEKNNNTFFTCCTILLCCCWWWWWGLHVVGIWNFCWLVGKIGIPMWFVMCCIDFVLVVWKNMYTIAADSWGIFNFAKKLHLLVDFT